VADHRRRGHRTLAVVGGRGRPVTCADTCHRSSHPRPGSRCWSGWPMAPPARWPRRSGPRSGCGWSARATSTPTATPPPSTTIPIPALRHYGRICSTSSFPPSSPLAHPREAPPCRPRHPAAPRPSTPTRGPAPLADHHRRTTARQPHHRLAMVAPIHIPPHHFPNPTTTPYRHRAGGRAGIRAGGRAGERAGERAGQAGSLAGGRAVGSLAGDRAGGFGVVRVPRHDGVAEGAPERVFACAVVGDADAAGLSPARAVARRRPDLPVPPLPTAGPPRATSPLGPEGRSDRRCSRTRSVLTT
jgi:hypothetical protein